MSGEYPFGVNRDANPVRLSGRGRTDAERAECDSIRGDYLAMLVYRLAQAHYDVPTVEALTNNSEDWTFGDVEAVRRAKAIAAHIRKDGHAE